MSTKTEPTAAQVAKLRKDHTWDEVRTALGVQWTDTKFRKLLREGGKADVIQPTGREPKTKRSAKGAK